MIRRKDGDDWLMISQLEHARLAAELARFAGFDYRFRIPLLKAIRHHDDGWWNWELRPTVDPETGKPRDFTEMPMTIATQIWTECIEICANPVRKEGSLAGGYWVSSHFTYLAEMALESRERDPDEGEEGDIPALQSFLKTQQPLQQEWSERARERHPEKAGENWMEQSVQWLQGFDWFSLWMCCAAETEPTTVPLPDGHSFRLVPGETGEIELHSETHAWFYPRVIVEVPAIRIPAKGYTDAEIAATLQDGPTETLQWTIVRV